MQHFEQEIAARASVNGVLADSRQDLMANSFGNRHQKKSGNVGRTTT
jgi:hypothetical protein